MRNLPAHGVAPEGDIDHGPGEAPEFFGLLGDGDDGGGGEDFLCEAGSLQDRGEIAHPLLEGEREAGFGAFEGEVGDHTCEGIAEDHFGARAGAGTGEGRRGEWGGLSLGGWAVVGVIPGWSVLQADGEGVCEESDLAVGVGGSAFDGGEHGGGVESGEEAGEVDSAVEGEVGGEVGGAGFLGCEGELAVVDLGEPAVLLAGVPGVGFEEAGLEVGGDPGVRGGLEGGWGEVGGPAADELGGLVHGEFVACEEFVGALAAEGDDAAVGAEALSDGVDGDLVGSAEGSSHPPDHVWPALYEGLTGHECFGVIGMQGAGHFAGAGEVAL